MHFTDHQRRQSNCSSTEVVAGPNSEGAESFSLDPPIMDPCSVGFVGLLPPITCSLNFKVKVGTGAVVITGGQDETFTVRDTVIEYSNIDQVVRQMIAI